MPYNFPIIYWSQSSTKVQFEPFTELPSDALITTCMVFVRQGKTVLLARPPRGWGLPGGHKESQESPEACAQREVFEETCVEIKNLTLVGGWKAQKIKHVEANRKYPEVAYQLLFVADVAHVRPFEPKHETLERRFVPYDKVEAYHHNYAQFAEIMRYVVGHLEGMA